MNSLTQFTDQVIHTSKDLFITETKNYFKKNFEIDSCHWVEVRETSSKLPSILKLKHELQNLKVDQSSLIADIDECVVEVYNSRDFQIWKNSKGRFMFFVWIRSTDWPSQCLVLNSVKIADRAHYQDFFDRLIPFLRRRWELSMVVGEAQKQVYRDSLTGLYNQKFLGEVVDKKIEEYRRYKTPFSVLFIDVDHFKKVNDSNGHLVGSGVLTQLGQLLQGQIRNSDYAFRYGGDEFIIILSHTQGEDAEFVAERIRKKVEDYVFPIQNLDVKITVSIGLAFYPVHAQSAEEIVRIADEAMYYGKHKSRNIVYKAS